MRQSLAIALMSAVLCAALAGCALNYDTTKSPRSPIEQLLLTQALQRGLIDAVPPVRPGQSVAIEAVGLFGLAADQTLVINQVERWLSREGFTVPKDGKETLVARVAIEAFGTLQDQAFFGLPPIGGGIIPISLPELAIYKAARQWGFARFAIDFVERQTGKLLRYTPVHEGDARYDQYTYFFAFNVTVTDLTPPPPP
jgi:hypothetical protein